MLQEKILPNNKEKEIQLKIEAKSDSYSFYYFIDYKEKILAADVDRKFLSTKVAGGFVGSVFALYATAWGTSSKNAAYFDWFEYKGDDNALK